MDSRILISWKEIESKAATLETIKKQVRLFKRNETFHFLTMLNNYLCLGDGAVPNDDGEVTDEETTKFLNTLFSPSLKAKIIGLWKRDYAAHKASRIIFSRTQLLLLMKFVLLWAEDDGELVPNENFIAKFYLGELLLMITDFLDLNVPTTLAETVVEVLPGFELTNPPPRTMLFDLISRSHEYIKTLRTDVNLLTPNGIAWPEFFESKENVPVETLLIIVAGILAQYLKYEDVRSYLDDPGAINFSREEYFRNFKKPSSQLDSFFRLSSKTIDQLAAEMKENYGVFNLKHDFLQFRESPIIFLSDDMFTCIDIHFLLEKFTTNLIYLIEASLPVHEDDPDKKNQMYLHQWRSHYGKAVESYVGDILDNAAPSTHHRNCEFGFKKDTYEIDSVMDYFGTLIWMECKGKKLSAKAKYSGDQEIFFDELDKKYGIGNKDAAIKQLTRKLGIVCHPDYQRDLKDWKFGFPTTIYPVLIVEDELLGFDIILDHLHKLFVVDRNKLSISRFMKIEELNILTITDLERIETFMLSGERTFVQLMDFASQFHKISPRISFSIIINKFVDANKLTKGPNPRLEAKYRNEITVLVAETFSD